MPASGGRRLGGYSSQLPTTRGRLALRINRFHIRVIDPLLPYRTESVLFVFQVTVVGRVSARDPDLRIVKSNEAPSLKLMRGRGRWSEVGQSDQS